MKSRLVIIEGAGYIFRQLFLWQLYLRIHLLVFTIMKVKFIKFVWQRNDSEI